ncbi:MAG: 2-amino-4-hydroxy-6-hydroxymethyldihydropteridine diphosphokinase [Rhodobacteraceae bacterium]|nr:MAG: 2-amino-4-hydroxy-6-hydroxymethyldihydropteridine diphosphokinase [Paracoccaceae bacterium]
MALIALGANLPLHGKSPKQTLDAAILRLSESGLAIRARSRFYETACFPPGAGPDYVNAALAATWEGSAGDLLALLHEVEAEFARARAVRWGMRTLDLDLIALGDRVLPDLATWTRWQGLPLAAQMRQAPDRLILPHPRMQERAFVLVPLCDVAPDWRHPVLGRTVLAMAAARPEDERAGVKAL